MCAGMSLTSQGNRSEAHDLADTVQKANGLHKAEEKYLSYLLVWMERRQPVPGCQWFAPQPQAVTAARSCLLSLHGKHVASAHMPGIWLKTSVLFELKKI